MTYYPKRKLSDISIDADLAMGAHNITLGAAQTVDGKDVSEGSMITNGTYAGNDSQNRAIAHGLGEIPKAIIIYDDQGQLFSMNEDAVTKINYITHVAMAVITHGSTTTTNFYVGMTASGYNHTANETGRTYYWIGWK